MLSSIKHYEINTNLDLPTLIKAKFVDGGSNPEIESPKMTFKQLIHDDIELVIELPVGDLENIKFNEKDNMKLVDTGLTQDDKEQIYTPFYEDKSFDYLKKVINAYNNEMDGLVHKGIFKEKIKELGD